MQRRLHVCGTEFDDGLEHEHRLDVEVGERLVVGQYVGEPERPPEPARHHLRHAGHLGDLLLRIPALTRNEEAVSHQQVEEILGSGPFDLLFGDPVFDKECGHASQGLGVGRRIGCGHEVGCGCEVGVGLALLEAQAVAPPWAIAPAPAMTTGHGSSVAWRRTVTSVPAA